MARPIWEKQLAWNELKPRGSTRIRIGWSTWENKKGKKTVNPKALGHRWGHYACSKLLSPMPKVLYISLRHSSIMKENKIQLSPHLHTNIRAHRVSSTESRHKESRRHTVYLVAQHSFLTGIPGKSFPWNFNLGRWEALGTNPRGCSAGFWCWRFQKDFRSSSQFWRWLQVGTLKVFHCYFSSRPPPHFNTHFLWTRANTLTGYNVHEQLWDARQDSHLPRQSR